MCIRDRLYSVPIGHVSALTSIAESPSSSEKAAASAGALSGLSSWPPVVSPSSTSSVSVPTCPRASSGLISTRTRHRSAAAAGTPRTSADYGFGRRTSAAATPKPPSTQRRPLTLRSRSLLRPITARRRPTWDVPPPSPATGPGGTPPVLPAPLPPVPRFPSPTPPIGSHRPDYRKPSSSLMRTHSYVPTSSTTPPPTGREDNAPSPSAPSPFGFFHWEHLHKRRTTSWITFPVPPDHFFRRFSPWQQKANYTPQTTTPFFSSTSHTRPLRA